MIAPSDTASPNRPSQAGTYSDRRFQRSLRLCLANSNEVASNPRASLTPDRVEYTPHWCIAPCIESVGTLKISFILRRLWRFSARCDHYATVCGKLITGCAASVEPARGAAGDAAGCACTIARRAPCSLSSVRQGGRSSVVERQLPKLYVVGSIPIARSIFPT